MATVSRQSRNCRERRGRSGILQRRLPPEVGRRRVMASSWIGGFVLCVYLIGFPLTVPRPLHRQRRSAGQNVRRATRQRSRLLPRQRRLDAYRRRGARQSGRECDGRRDLRRGIATGIAAMSIKKQQQVSGSVFLRRRRTGQGLLYETMNMASLWKFAVIYVCENRSVQRVHPLPRNHCREVPAVRKPSASQ